VIAGLLITAWLQAAGQVPKPAEPALKEAVLGQARFERGRRQLLPVTGGGGGRCDARIGRFCYWYDDADTALPAEPPAVRRERERLLTTLERAADSVPASDWLWGQRVRYLIDHELPDSAWRELAGCGGSPWWCLALSGMSLHAAGRYRAADSAFALSLAAMPDTTRCAWNDWEAVVGDRRLRGDDPAGCDRRWALMDTLFWLGQPLLAIDGNDLRTELLSRRVMAAIQAAAVPPHLVSWGNDLEELMLRYGWSRRWSLTSFPSAAMELPSLVGHDRPPAYWFFPIRGDSAAAWRWAIDADRPASRYAPAYLRGLDLSDDASIALFPRGDSTIVVAGFGARAWPNRGVTTVNLALGASSAPSHSPDVSRRTASALGSTLELRVAGQPSLVSLEAEDDGHRFLRHRVYRERRSISPLSLSDLLLFAVDSALPSALDQVLPRAIAGRRIARTRPIGVYWEWSASVPDSIAVTIAAVPVRRGLLGRVAQGLALSNRRAPLSLEWQAGMIPKVPEGRAVELDLSRLAPGRYHIRLTARTPGYQQATELPIELER